MIADNGGVINVTLFTGTTADEGLIGVTPTASPAITPAWTGLATLATQAFTLTTSYSRFTMTPVLVPTTVKELGVAICFTPTVGAVGSATDGFVITGTQLEPTTGSNVIASSFEFRPVGVELLKAQRYYFNYNDSIATTQRIAMCQSTTTTVGLCIIPHPVTMFKIPTITVTTATSFGITIPAGTQTACTTLAPLASGHTTQASTISCTSGATQVAGSASQLVGAATGATNFINFSADL